MADLRAILDAVHVDRHWWIDQSEIEFPQEAPLVGQGGFGVVLKARFYDSECAVKVIHMEPILQQAAHAGVAPAEFVADMIRCEMSSLTELHSSAHIASFWGVCIPDQGQYPMQLWLVMQHIPGCNLRALLQSPHMPAVGSPERQALSLLLCRAVAGRLRYIHHKGVAHLDLKPENVMLSATSAGDAQVRLVDFGIARMTGSLRPGSTTLQTFAVRALSSHYCAPEMELLAAGEPVSGITVRADVYSFGVMALELLTGKAARVIQLQAASLLQTAVSDPRARELFAACLSHTAEQRPAASRVCEVLDAVLAAVPAPLLATARRIVACAAGADDATQRALLAEQQAAAEVERAQQRASQAEARVQQMASELQQAQAEKQQLTTQLQQAQVEKQTSASQLQQAQQKLQQSEVEKRQVASQLQDALTRAQQAEQRAATLEQSSKRKHTFPYGGPICRNSCKTATVPWVYPPRAVRWPARAQSPSLFNRISVL